MGRKPTGRTTKLIRVPIKFEQEVKAFINRSIPWNYAKFLEYAANLRFIQRVGGRYRFMHDLLRKHFAQMPLS